MNDFRHNEVDAARNNKEPFSYDGYQIVRREMFAHIREPAAVIRKDSITFNTACINGLEDTVYIEIMINSGRHSIVIQESSENVRDAQRWCVAKPDKRTSRKIRSTHFTQNLYKLMDWSDKCRYKVQGERLDLPEGTIYVFDLEQCEIIYERKKKTKEEVLTEPPGSAVPDEEKAERKAEEEAMKRKPFYPDDWENSFGIPVKAQRFFDIDMLRNGDSFVSIKIDQEE